MSTTDNPDRLMKLATYASTATAALLIAVKLAAWMATGSVALLSTLIDSTLDLAASALNLMAVRHALVPADDDHRFGHGKAEALAGMGQAAFVVGSGGFLLAEAGNRMVHPQPVSHGEWGIAVMVFSILATFALVGFQRMVAKRTGSLAISADSLHYTGDLLINAWQIFRLSLDTLMDKELPEADRERIRAIVTAHPGVQDHHDLRTRTSGRQGFIQFHLELPGHLPLVEAHRISDDVEKSILAEFPGFDVIIHEDPAGVRESRTEFR